MTALTVSLGLTGLPLLSGQSLASTTSTGTPTGWAASGYGAYGGYGSSTGGTSTVDSVASTGRSYAATVVGYGETTDVALLKLSGAHDLQAAAVDDETVSVDDPVTAVGNAGGTGTLTAADGTVTDLSSTITTGSEGAIAAETLNGLIETYADVVPGDSGGPLVDAEGEAIGIDTAASSGVEIDRYAIPIAQALAVVKQILAGEQSGTVQIGSTAFFGVELTDQTYGFSSGGTIAGVVDGSAAALLGLSPATP